MLNEREFLKKINEFMESVYSLDEKICKYNQEKEYLQNIKHGIALLKIKNKISKNNIDKIAIELINQVNSKYQTNYRYLENYIVTIDNIINDIDVLINKYIQDKLNETAIKKLMEVFDNNEH